MAQGLVWKPDTQLRQQPDGTYQVEAGPFRAQFAATLGTSPLYTFEVAGDKFGFTPSALAWVDAKGNKQVLASVANVAPTISDDGTRITYDAPQYAVTYVIEGAQVKMHDILKERLPDPDPTLVDVSTAYLSVMGYLTLPPGLSPWAEGMPIDPSTPFRTAAQIELRDDQLNTVMLLDYIQGTDAAGIVMRGEYLVQWSGTAWQLSTLVSWTQLRYAAYPVDIDPTTVATSTNNQATGYSNQRKVDRFSNGVLFAMFSDGTNIVCRYSSDNGTTWQTPGAGATIAAVNNPGSVFIEKSSDCVYTAHWNGVGGIIILTRGVPNAARTSYTWTTLNAMNVATGVNYPDLWVHAEGTGWKAHVVATNNNDGGLGVTYYQRVNIASDGTMTRDGTAVTLGSSVGTTYQYPSISLDAAKNLYAVWLPANTVTLNKATYSGGTWTWGTAETVDPAAVTSGPHISSIVDTSGRCIVAFIDGATSKVKVVERSAAGVYTNRTGTLSVTMGNNGLSIVTDGQDNIFLAYAPNPGVFYVKFDRVAGTWGSAVTVDSTTTRGFPAWRRDFSGGALDLLYTAGTASPYNVTSYRLSVNVAPNAPQVTPSPPAFDAADGVAITIAHQDPDPGDPMSAYSLRRQYGSGPTTEYWNATTKLWVGTETFNTASGTSATVLAADNATKWSNGTTYQLSAATRDAAGLTGPYASNSLVTVSAKPVVTITSPANAGTVTTGTITAQWTVSDPEGKGQSAYQVRLLDNSNAQLETTGKVSDINARSRTMTTIPANATTYKVEVTAWDGDGVASVAVINAFTTSFTPPATPGVSASASSATTGVILTASAAPSGGSNRFERSSDGGTTWTALATTSGNTYTDYATASGIAYQYRVTAIGSNAATATSTTTTATMTMTDDWFIVPADGSAPIPCRFSATVSGQRDQARSETSGRGKFPIAFYGGRNIYRARLAALLVDASLAGGIDTTGYTARQWYDRVETLVTAHTTVYLKSRNGRLYRGELYNLADDEKTDYVYNGTGLTVEFRETGVA